MAADETSIANLALAKLGISPIMALTDDSKPAQFANRFYTQTRDEVLQAHRWNFAIERATLSMLAKAPPFEWSYAFQLPSDCLRVLQVNGYEDYERQDLWSVEQGRLLSDSPEAKLKYIARIEDAGLYHPMFVEALACKLASKLAGPLIGSNTIASSLLEEYIGLTGPRARLTDAFENSHKRKMPWVNSPLVHSRYVGG